jgi:hypothetical protein
VRGDQELEPALALSRAARSRNCAAFNAEAADILAESALLKLSFGEVFPTRCAPLNWGPSAARTERKFKQRVRQWFLSNTSLTPRREAARLRGPPTAHRAGGSAPALTRRGAPRLNAQLGRWISADPLAVHAPGQADLNLYAYVRGTVSKATDPLGLYEEPVHGALTYRLALVAGFSREDSATIALSDAAVDHDIATDPVRPESIADGTTTEYHFASSEEAMNGVVKAVNDGDLHAFGRALHTSSRCRYRGGVRPPHSART